MICVNIYVIVSNCTRINFFGFYQNISLVSACKLSCFFNVFDGFIDISLLGLVTFCYSFMYLFYPHFKRAV